MVAISNIEFIHVPRTGGTTILTHLSALDPSRFQPNRDHFAAMQKLAVDPTFQNKYSFAVHRNPFDRLVSVWQYQVMRALQARDSRFAPYGEFNAWLYHYAGTLEWQRNYLILPQWFWVSDWDSRSIVTEMFGYTKFDFMLSRLEALTGHKFDRSLIVNEGNKTHNYKDLASPESKKIMLELCKIDCEKFNYDW